MNIKKFSFDDKLLIAVCIFCIAALLIPPLDFIKTWVLRLGYGIGCAGILYLTVCTTVFRKGVKNVKLKIGAAISLLLGNTPNCLSSGCERAATILDNDFRAKIS